MSCQYSFWLVSDWKCTLYILRLFSVVLGWQVARQAGRWEGGRHILTCGPTGLRRRHKTYFATIANLLNQVNIFAVVSVGGRRYWVQNLTASDSSKDTLPLKSAPSRLEKLSRQSQSATRAAVLCTSFFQVLWSRLADKISSEVGRAN